jgi:YfiH family protein
MNEKELVTRALETSDWELREREGIEFLVSPLLERASGGVLVHCFTTRKGGNTPSPYHSFNLGRHIKDEVFNQDALDNRQALMKALNLSGEFMKVPAQVHSGNVFKIDLAARHDANLSLKEVDGLLTDVKETPLLLHFADCVPVMLYDTKKQVVAVVHAGWRGTAQSIAARALFAMSVEYGTVAADVVAAVGPAIGTCCFPTGEEVQAKLLASLDEVLTLRSESETGLIKSAVLKELAAQRLIEGEENEQPRPHLKGFNALQLYLMGVRQVDVSAFCTSCRPDVFFSHRQSQGITGRQGALACLV